LAAQGVRQPLLLSDRHERDRAVGARRGASRAQTRQRGTPGPRDRALTMTRRHREMPPRAFIVMQAGLLAVGTLRGHHFLARLRLASPLRPGRIGARTLAPALHLTRSA